MMSTLAYFLLGLVAQATLQPVNEAFNTGSHLNLWNLAEQLSEQSISYSEIDDAIELLIDEHLIEPVPPEQYPGRMYRLRAHAEAAATVAYATTCRYTLCNGRNRTEQKGRGTRHDERE